MTTFDGVYQVINLDVMEPDDLDKLAHELGKLQTYARFKAQSMRLRARGACYDASFYESQCDYIYSTLPNEMKW